jgi:hypothetical protein
MREKPESIYMSRYTTRAVIWLYRRATMLYCTVGRQNMLKGHVNEFRFPFSFQDLLFAFPLKEFTECTYLHSTILLRITMTLEGE